MRFLKVLVTTLMVVMIVGLVTIVGVLVTRLGTSAPLPVLPASVVLPEGARPVAITFARDWLVVVTDDARVLVYPASGGDPAQVLDLR